jgi:hypothetical protein
MAGLLDSRTGWSRQPVAGFMPHAIDRARARRRPQRRTAKNAPNHAIIMATASAARVASA